MFSRWIVTNITSARRTLHCRKTRIPCGDQLVICGLYCLLPDRAHINTIATNDILSAALLRRIVRVMTIAPLPRSAFRSPRSNVAGGPSEPANWTALLHVQYWWLIKPKCYYLTQFICNALHFAIVTIDLSLITYHWAWNQDMKLTEIINMRVELQLPSLNTVIIYMKDN
jgi:hypothetical protein